MIKQLLIFAILPASVGATLPCTTDQPEIGDIGPGSELVCKELALRFPDAALAVESRSVHSPIAVSVIASVDGRSVSLRYELTGYTWRLDEAGARIADVPIAQVSPPVIVE